MEPDMAQVAAALEGPDPAEGLRAVTSLRRLTDDLESEQVHRARRQGWSWRDIGAALGVSGQAVHKKHRRS